MIQTIHYCWLGSPLPENVQAQIQNWQKICPNYNIKQWDESNTDLWHYDYYDRMMKEKMWGFASDIVRFAQIYQHGGFYLDCDVELKKSLDLLPAPADHLIMGYMYDCALSGGVFYAPAQHPLIGKLLDYYTDISPTFYPVSNTIITHCINNNVDDFKLNGRFFTSEKYKITILPKEYLCQPSFCRNKPFAIDQFAGSWKNADKGFTANRGQMTTLKTLRRKLGLFRSLIRNEFRNPYLAAQYGKKIKCVEYWRKEFGRSGGALKSFP